MHKTLLRRRSTGGTREIKRSRSQSFYPTQELHSYQNLVSLQLHMREASNPPKLFSQEIMEERCWQAEVRNLRSFLSFKYFLMTFCKGKCKSGPQLGGKDKEKCLGLWSPELHQVKASFKRYNWGSNQDGRVGKCCAYILSKPRQHYNKTVKQPSLTIAWKLAELKPYN